MKKIIKNNIFGFILGIIFASSAGVIAYSISANNVSYNPNNTDFTATNVQEALDELYSNNNKLEISNITTKVLYNNAQYDSNSRNFKYTITQNDIDSYDYFIIGSNGNSYSTSTAITNIGSTRIELHNGFLSLGYSKMWLAKTTDCLAGQTVSATGTYYAGVFVIGIKLG